MAQYFVWTCVHLGLWSLMLLAAAGFGHLFLRRYLFDSLAERSVFTLALGLGLCAVVIFALGVAGLFYREIFLGLTISGAIATALFWIRSHKSRLMTLPRWRMRFSMRGGFLLFLITIGVGYWGLLLLSTQYPPLHWDAIAYHLVLCREYLAHHRMVAVMDVPFPVVPALNHMLFTWGMALQDDILAQMMSHTFFMLTAVGLFAWGKRERKPLLGIAVAALWLGSPLVLWVGESCYVDVCLVSFAFLGVYALRIFWEGRESTWWYLSMAMVGFGAGVKLPGLFFLIVGGVLGLFVLLQNRFKGAAIDRLSEPGVVGVDSEKRRPFDWKPLIRGWAVALVILIPWYGFVFYHTGNPLWPTFPRFARGVWGSPAFIASMNTWFNTGGEPRTLKNFLMLSINLIVHPEGFEAEVGRSVFPLIMVWPLAWIVAFWNRSVRWWTVWAFGFTAYWFMFPNLLRYWLPALPFAGLALYEVIRWVIERVSRSASFHAAVWVVLALLAVVNGAMTIRGEIAVKGWPPPLNATEREAFLPLLGGYKGVSYINKQAGENDTVCVINGSYLNYYFKPRVLDLGGLMHQPDRPEFHWPEDTQWMELLDSKNVNWIFVNYTNTPPSLKIPTHNLAWEGIWPDYTLVFANDSTWVFRHKPIPPEVW